MAQRTRRSDYPIGRFLLRLYEEVGGSLPEFLSLIGYRNTQKAIKRFDHWLDHGCGEGHILDNVKRWRPEIAEELEQALVRTEVILEQERRAEAERLRQEERVRFRPYVEAIPEEREPRSISLFAVTGGAMRQRAALPFDIVERSDAERLRIIGETIRAHMQRSEGKTLFQGRIVVYQAFLSFEREPITFTTGGILMGEDIDRRPGEATLVLKGGRPFPGTFR